MDSLSRHAIAGRARQLGSSRNEVDNKFNERWALVARYYEKTSNERKSMSSEAKARWRRWLMKEADKADKSDNKHYRSKDALMKRIKAKWWAVNHRYSDNKNKRRNAMKRYILKQASYQDLYKVQNWVEYRKKLLRTKGIKTRMLHRGRDKANASHHKQLKGLNAEIDRLSDR